jgi:hypothetical protein
VAVIILAVFGAFSTERHFREASLTNTELTRFLLPSAAPKRLKEGCPELRSAVAGASSDSRFTSGHLIRSALALSPDEIGVYRAVLSNAVQRGWKRLNISVTTNPLSANDFRDCECFQDITLENLPAAFHSSHLLTDAVLPTDHMRLVNGKRQSSLVRFNDPIATIREGKPVNEAVDTSFSTGLFSMSEVAFDKEHRYAVVSYRFWCGLLCGNGATLIFEKVGNEWTSTSRDCGSWMS